MEAGREGECWRSRCFSSTVCDGAEMWEQRDWAWTYVPFVRKEMN